jgi:hypothetical protein
VSCGPHPSTSRTEQAAEAEFARIDNDARGICPEDYERLQVYVGTVSDVTKAADGALGRANDIARRLDEFLETERTAAWTVRTLARKGLLYDCIWNCFRNATPGVFTPDQQAVLNTSSMSPPIPATPGQVDVVQKLIDDAKEQVLEKWRLTRDQYLEALGAKTLQSYVIAALFARRYAIEGFDLTRARKRLTIVSWTLGEPVARRLLSQVADPTDPAPESDRRSLGEVVSASILTGSHSWPQGGLRP